MNILYGLYHPDEGEIRLRGEPARISSPREAIDLGIGMVHQHFMLIPVMTVTENIVLDRKSTRLNSSHANISYAVFCLKKKNIMIVVILSLSSSFSISLSLSIFLSICLSLFSNTSHPILPKAFSASVLLSHNTCRSAHT